jgi:hypothetical protein
MEPVEFNLRRYLELRHQHQYSTGKTTVGAIADQLFTRPKEYTLERLGRFSKLDSRVGCCYIHEPAERPG